MAVACILAAAPVFWGLSTTVLTGPAAVTGIPAVNSLASIASFLGPYLTGAMRQTTGDFRAALFAVAGCLTGITSRATGHGVPSTAQVSQRTE